MSHQVIAKNISLTAFAAAVRTHALPVTDVRATRRAGAYLPLSQLEAYLTEALQGLSLKGLALKTRSKKVRQNALAALGYVPPATFGSDVIFPAQNADIYVQKANNLQIWNEKIDQARRYLVVVVDENDVVAGVRAFTGKTLAQWNRTGTLTAKFQARLKLVFNEADPFHVCGRDTERTVQFTGAKRVSGCPMSDPVPGALLPIDTLGKKLSTLIGTTVPFVSAVDDKKRSAALLQAVAKALGYEGSEDSVTFPDLPGQMLEVKLQTSDTIDLGRTWPSSDSPLNFQLGRAKLLRRRDTRFAVFYGTRVGKRIRLDKLVVTPGARFWDVFEPLKGNERNTKLQIKLPAHAMAV
jgi:hypothetical protein